MSGAALDAPVVVAGSGAGGAALAAALHERGAQVTLLDAGRTGGLPAGTGLVVASADGPPDAPLLEAAAVAGVEVVGEAELVWRLRPAQAPWLAVTGTRGAGATVALLGAVLAAAGVRALVVDGVRSGLVDALGDGGPGSADVVAVALTRRQLHRSSTLRPHTAVVLDVEPDDDGFGSTAARTRAAGQVHGAGTVAVYVREDLETVRLAAGADARAGVTLGSPAAGELGLVEDLLVDRAFPHLPSGDVPGEAAVLATLDDLGPPDVPRLARALAAAALARSYGVPAVAVRDGLRAARP